jgi:RND superfamily putative drug exporter
MSEPPLGGPLTRGYARVVTRLRFVIVAAWIAGACAATLLLPSLSEGEGGPLGGLIAEDSESVKARTRSAELFQVPILGETAVVQRNPDGLSEDAQLRVVQRAAAVLEQGSEGPVSFALPVMNTERLFPSSRESSTTAVTFLFFPRGTSIGDQRSLAEEWAETNVSRPDDHLVGVTGAVPARVEEASQIEDALPWIEIATVLAIAAILGLTFRSVGAPLVSLVSAALAYLVTVRILPWLGDQMGVGMPREIEPLVVVLLLGIVTDYAIFFLSGLRTRLGLGEPRLTAAQNATAQNVPIVLTAGLIVAAGAMTLLAGHLDYFRVLGPGMALTAVMALLVSVTLVPALLAIFGRAVFWPSRARTVPAQEERPAPGAGMAAAPTRRPLRERIAHLATARPVAGLIVIVVLAGLVAAASGLRDLNLGFTLVRGLPAGSEPRVAELAAAQGFSPGIIAPTELIVEQQGLARRRDRLVDLEELIARQDGVAGVLGPREEPADIASNAVVSKDGNAARIAVILEQEPLGGDAIDTIEALDERMPSLLRQAGLEGATVSFGGDTGLARDTVNLTVSDLERIALAVLLVNFLFLVVFLRSLVAPLLLLVSSIVVLGATLGLTTYVFQGILGYHELTYYVPFAAAVLLVSLGSDYNVFVVGRVWEEARRRPLREAIATATPRASKAITVAGLALAASFALLAIVPLRAFRELAFALSVGVLLDAFVARSLLVPALISLFGDLSWWPSTRRIARRREAALQSTSDSSSVSSAPVRGTQSR